jgi:hypothetical protein
MTYKRILKPVRFDIHLLEMSDRYMKMNDVNFSTLVRVSLSSFLTKKLYDIDDHWTVD